MPLIAGEGLGGWVLLLGTGPAIWMWSVGCGVTQLELMGLMETIWYLTSILVVVGFKGVDVLFVLVDGVEEDVCLCGVVGGMVCLIVCW